MADRDIALMAHLMRRAGFGATREELERYAAKGYEATVVELLHPEDAPTALEDEDLIRRYHVDENNLMVTDSAQAYWLYRMINTKRPLEEKLALFWHGVFATAYTKVNLPKAILRQIDMFRRFGMGSFRTLLIELSKDPAMIIFLDNKDNHGDAVNENYGRELLELFSRGVGNYSEDDVRQCSRAFTGWTIRNAPYHTARLAQDALWPYGKLDLQFQYIAEAHDPGQKMFLGEEGRFNGEEIIDLICRQPATARFISRHLYNFFVADDAPVPAWKTIPPRNPEAIEFLGDAFVKYDYDIRSMLRVLFNSDFFKNAEFAKVKSPTELAVGTVRLTGGHRFPGADDAQLAIEVGNMGQQLLNPPSVEGWHTGVEWLDTGNLVRRVDFGVDQFADADKQGVRSIIDRIQSKGSEITPESLVDGCLDLIGPLAVSESTREELIAHAVRGSELRFGSEEEDRIASTTIREILQLITATREYQLA